MNFALTIVIMAVASYLPRFIPLVFCRKKIENVFIKSVLAYMPYAVLACLTFPAIFYSTGSVVSAIIATLVAVVMSVFKVNMALVALVCVGVVFGVGLF